MQHAKQLVLVGMLQTLVACDLWEAKRAASEWITDQNLNLTSPRLPPVPEFVDTPPAAYTAKTQDPFDPSRTSARYVANTDPGKSGVLFPDVPVASISIVGFITGPTSGRVAVLRSGGIYRSVRPGDRIGEQMATVKQIDEQGLLLMVDGVDNQWLLRNK